jgi:hypothetical protein
MTTPSDSLTVLVNCFEPTVRALEIVIPSNKIEPLPADINWKTWDVSMRIAESMMGTDVVLDIWKRGCQQMAMSLASAHKAGISCALQAHIEEPARVFVGKLVYNV